MHGKLFVITVEYECILCKYVLISSTHDALFAFRLIMTIGAWSTNLSRAAFVTSGSARSTRISVTSDDTLESIRVCVLFVRKDLRAARTYVDTSLSTRQSKNSVVLSAKRNTFTKETCTHTCFSNIILTCENHYQKHQTLEHY